MPTKKKYSLKVKVNNEEFTKRTDNIEEGIMALKPAFVHTEMYLTAKGGDMVSERKLNLVQARKLFSDSDYRQIFIHNLLLQ